MLHPHPRASTILASRSQARAPSSPHTNSLPQHHHLYHTHPHPHHHSSLYPASARCLTQRHLHPGPHPHPHSHPNQPAVACFFLLQFFSLLMLVAKLALACLAMKSTHSQLLFPFQVDPQTRTPDLAPPSTNKTLPLILTLSLILTITLCPQPHLHPAPNPRLHPQPRPRAHPHSVSPSPSPLPIPQPSLTLNLTHPHPHPASRSRLRPRPRSPRAAFSSPTAVWQLFDLTFLYVFFSLRSFVSQTSTSWIINTVLLQASTCPTLAAHPPLTHPT